jgi:hypothetical protein
MPPMPKLLMFAAFVMFLLACLTAGGVSIGGIAAWVWGFAGFAAVALAWCLERAPVTSR